jgi:hypothetical protein
MLKDILTEEGNDKLSSYASKVRRRSDEIHEHWMNVSTKSTGIYLFIQFQDVLI